MAKYLRGTLVYHLTHVFGKFYSQVCIYSLIQVSSQATLAINSGICLVHC